MKGRRKLFASLLLFIIVFFVYSCKDRKTLHLIVFADTQELRARPRNGQISRNSVAECDTIKKVLIPRLRRYYSVKVDYTLCRDDNFVKENVDSIIACLTTKDKDVIVFYYTGHGFNDSTSQFPRLLVPLKNGGQGSVHLVDIYAQLKDHPHSLLFVIAEACNNYPQRPLGVDPSRFNERDDVLFKADNLDCVKNYIVSSSKQGQLSHAKASAMGNMAKVAIQLISESHPSVRNKDFRTFFNTLSTQTKEYSRSISETKQQDPIWIAE